MPRKNGDDALDLPVRAVASMRPRPDAAEKL